MFGLNFNKTPIVPAPDEGMSNLDIRNILEREGVLKEGDKITEDDYSAIRNRAQIIAQSHPGLGEETYVELAFLDRAINSADLLHVPYEVATHNSELVALLISDPSLTANEEFLNTVLNKAEDIYTSDKIAYSDALFRAIKERTAEYKSSGVSGKISSDGIVTLDNKQ